MSNNKKYIKLYQIDKLNFRMIGTDCRTNLKT